MRLTKIFKIIDENALQIQTPTFRNWFGNSKVVDAHGQPLRVYKGMHALDDDGNHIDTIDRKSDFPAFNGTEKGFKISGFFAADPNVANRFSHIFYNPVGSVSTFPVYLKMERPFIIDAKGDKAGNIQFGETGKVFRDAIRSGKYDGVIIKNTKDEGDIYIALKPENIKSATGNNGNFNQNSPKISENYQGEHGAPDHENGAPLYNLTVLYPADVYSGMGRSYYAGDAPNSFYIAMSCKGHPNKQVTVYRAVPKDVIKPRINPGDWVTLDRAYANEHGTNELKNSFTIIKKIVCARDLYTEGNSFDEWGYIPHPYFSIAQEDEVRKSMGMKTKSEARAERYPVQETTNQISWVRPKGTQSFDVVWIDVAKFDKAFKNDSAYIVPGGTNGIRNRYQNFGEWLKQGIPVEMPMVSIGEDGYRNNVVFTNGRHRFSWMRDHGAKTLPIVVPKEQAAPMAKLYGSNDHTTHIFESIK